MPKIIKGIPAISAELEFLSRHGYEADEIWDGNIQEDKSLVDLLDIVEKRASQDAVELLKNVQSATDAGRGRLLRIVWRRPSRERWKLDGSIFMPHRGPRTRLGGIGFYLDYEIPRLVGWMYPRIGGLDGRREIKHACARRIDGVHLASDFPERYSDWEGEDAVIWLSEKLSKRSRDELAAEIKKRAKVFLKIAEPILKRRVDQN